MFKKLSFAVAALASFLSLSLPYGCYYDNEADLYGTSACDTTSVTYSTGVVNVLANNCYSCHNAANANDAGGGYQFDSYTLLTDFVTSGTLLNRINDAQNPMPPTGLIDNCQRLKIQAWINEGAQDN